MYDFLLKLAENPYSKTKSATRLSCSNQEIQDKLITELGCIKEMACETHVVSSYLEE